jgi:hypothetical protein
MPPTRLAEKLFMFFLDPIIKELKRINQQLAIIVQRSHDIFDQLVANGRKEERIEEELDRIVKLLMPTALSSVASFKMSVTPIAEG